MQKRKDPVNRREALTCQLLLGDFRPEESKAVAFLERMTPNGSLTRDSLILLGEMCSAITGIDFPRNCKRRRSLIIKWFNDHLDELSPLSFLLQIDLRAKKTPKREVIALEDERSEQSTE
jgi:hypothetical protein